MRPRGTGNSFLGRAWEALPIEVRRRSRVRASAYGDYDLGDEISAAGALVEGHSMLSTAGLATLYQQVAHLEREGIEGAIVECGVWHGGSAALAAQASMRHGDGRRPIHLFDSFRGIPEPIAELDGERAVREVGGEAHAEGRLQVASDYGDRGGPGSEAVVRKLLQHVGYGEAAVTVHQGWFQETVPRAAATIGPIALLHLDGDWYESTRTCLDHLYRHVSEGGIVVVNDYGAYAGCRRAVDEFLAARPPRPYLSHVDRDIRFWIKC